MVRKLAYVIPFVLGIVVTLFALNGTSVVAQPQAPASADAIVGYTFTYQGVLKNGGTGVNDTCDFQFGFWDALTLGAQIGATVTNANVAVANGLFTTRITAPAGSIDGNARYLAVAARCPAGSGSYTAMTPRQELTAAPYALGLKFPLNHTVDYNGTLFSVKNTNTTTNAPTFYVEGNGGDALIGKSVGGALADNGVYGDTNSTSFSEAGVYGKGTGGSAAVYANGDVRQTQAGNGIVKAGAYVNCSIVGSSVARSFNNVNATAITVTGGPSVGECTVDFGFKVSDRFVVVTPALTSGAFMVSEEFTGLRGQEVSFRRYNAAGIAANG